MAGPATPQGAARPRGESGGAHCQIEICIFWGPSISAGPSLGLRSQWQIVHSLHYPLRGFPTSNRPCVQYGALLAPDSWSVMSPETPQNGTAEYHPEDGCLD